MDRRYRYGDLNRRLDFCPASYFVGSFHRPLEGPDQPLVIGLALKVGGSRWLRSEDAALIDSRATTKKAQTRSNARHQKRRTASSTGFATCPTILGGCSPFTRALLRLAENTPRSEPVLLLPFHHGGDADLKSAISGLRTNLRAAYRATTEQGADANAPA
jgi:hypothetical protein